MANNMTEHFFGRTLCASDLHTAISEVVEEHGNVPVCLHFHTFKADNVSEELILDQDTKGITHYFNNVIALELLDVLLDTLFDYSMNTFDSFGMFVLFDHTHGILKSGLVNFYH